MTQIQLATFRCDVTPPIGHPLCAGWVAPAVAISDRLYADGVILCGEGQPIVLCTIDWCEISNRSHIRWRQEIADAVGTTSSRVVVHCMHPHCTPFPDEEAQTMIEGREGVPAIIDPVWCNAKRAAVAAAAKQALGALQPVTHFGCGKGQVEKVASNRRIMGDDGKVKAVRWCRTYDAEVRAEPEGLIDPFLKSISFWNGDQKLAVLHYYAVHPSSYEESIVSPDFTGLAREQRRAEDNGIPHMYFTECAGNVTPGKYNDGAHEKRAMFTERIHAGMVASEAATVRYPLNHIAWTECGVTLPPREDMQADKLMAIIEDEGAQGGHRNKAAIQLSYLNRLDTPIQICALHLGEHACIVHLPGESFMEYQKFAQETLPNAMVLVPSYGDCGPGYICMESSFEEGGYEPHDAFVSGASEPIMKKAISQVMKQS